MIQVPAVQNIAVKLEIAPETKKFDVNVILQKDNTYFFNGNNATTITSVKMENYPHVLPSGTKVEIFDTSNKKFVQYYLVHEQHATCPVTTIPNIPKDTKFVKFESEYLINHRGLVVTVPTDTLYSTGLGPVTKTCVPTEFILPQRCRFILPKHTLIRAMNGRDALALPADRVGYLADVLLNA